MFKTANYSKKEINQPRKPKIKKIENETSREREGRHRGKMYVVIRGFCSVVFKVH